MGTVALIKSRLLAVACLIVIVTQVVVAKPLSRHQQHDAWIRSIREIETDPDSVICAPFDGHNNSVMIADLRGQTTALFKIRSFDISESRVMHLQRLREKFAAAGFRVPRFYVIVVDDNADEMDSKAAIDYDLDDLNEMGNVTFVSVTDDPLFEALADRSATVLDACGNVAYSVFHPWSLLEYPYVKAALLSATFDQPCGHCDHVSIVACRAWENRICFVFGRRLLTVYYCRCGACQLAMPIVITFG